MKRLFEKMVILGLGLVFVVSLGWNDAVAQGKQADLSQSVNRARETGVPASLLNDLLTLGFESGLNKAEMSNLVDLLALAHKEGLPVQPLVSKMEEGMVKRVPASKIDQAVLRKLHDYRDVRSMLTDFLARHRQDAAVAPEHLVRLTESLYSGLSREDMKRVFDRAPAVPVPALTRGVEVFAFLRQVKFEPNLAEEVVIKGISANYFSSERRDFARAIATARRKGMPDREIAGSALTAIANHSSSDEFCSMLRVSADDLGHVGARVGKSHDGSGHGAMGQGGGHGLGHGGSAGAHGGDAGGHAGGHGGGDGGGGGGGSGGGGGGGGGCN